MANKPFLPLFVGDYMAKCFALSASQHGAYLCMLFYAWGNDGKLPQDLNEIYHIACVRSDAEKDAADYVLAKYWNQHEDGSYVNDRLVEVSNTVDHLRNIKQDAANRRWSLHRTMHNDKNACKTDDSASSASCGASCTSAQSAYAKRRKNNAHASKIDADALNPIHIQEPTLASTQDLTSKSFVEAAVVGRPRASFVENPTHNLQHTYNGESLGITSHPQSEELGNKIANACEKELVHWNGKNIEVADELGLRWQSAFPELRVPEEVERAAVWLASHPDQQPPSVQHWLGSWLLRSQRMREPKLPQ